MGEVVRFVPKSELERARLIERPAPCTSTSSRRPVRQASGKTPRNERWRTTSFRAIRIQIGCC